MYRKQAFFFVRRIFSQFSPSSGVLPTPSQVSFGRVNIVSRIESSENVSISGTRFLSTSGPRYLNQNRNHKTKPLRNNQFEACDFGNKNLRLGQYQPYVVQRRFSNKDSKLRHVDEDLTLEELKVLKKLEREDAKIKDDKANKLSLESEVESGYLKQSVSQEYVPFENQQRIIQDVIEEIWNPLPQQDKLVYEPPEEFLQRGKTGVFDLGELVDLLREENGMEIVAITLPKEIDYADQMLVVTAKNPRHLMALSTYVRKRYKMKNLKKTDVIPAIVSEDIQQGWIALDLGNIILHVFLQEQRDLYDLELLWTVGPLFDDLYNAKDPEIIQLLNMMK